MIFDHFHEISSIFMIFDHFLVTPLVSSRDPFGTPFGSDSHCKTRLGPRLVVIPTVRPHCGSTRRWCTVYHNSPHRGRTHYPGYHPPHCRCLHVRCCHVSTPVTSPCAYNSRTTGTQVPVLRKWPKCQFFTKMV